MIDLEFSFTGKLWEYSGKGSWHFVTVPESMSGDIRTFTKHLAKGFRSVRVTVKIGASEWQTSLFPDSKSGCYFLPVKAEIRKKEDLVKGRDITIDLSVMV